MVLRIPPGPFAFAYGDFTLSVWSSQFHSARLFFLYAVLTPGCKHPGLGSPAFARRYLRDHCCFLFLRLLRCFSSPGSLHTPIDSVHGTWTPSMWVSPFRHLRIIGYLLLPTAFRSLSRLSSALGARASSLRSFLADLSHVPSVVHSQAFWFFLSSAWCVVHTLRPQVCFYVCCFFETEFSFSPASDVFSYPN